MPFTLPTPQVPFTRPPLSSQVSSAAIDECLSISIGNDPTPSFQVVSPSRGRRAVVAVVATTPSERHHRNMASTWTTERLKQLVAWNGKVTAGAYAVVISEASLRSTEKLPSEGATGHDAA